MRQMVKTNGFAGEVDAFLDHCRAEGLSPATVNRSYGMALRRVLTPFCERAGIASFDKLSTPLVERLGRELRAGTLAESSVKSYLRSIRVFLRWRGQKAVALPMGPKLRKVARDPLSTQEMRALEDAAPKVRDQLIIRILADTGAREGEVANLRVSDLLERGAGSHFLRLKGKTGERLAPINNELWRRLRDYRRSRPEVDTDRLFLAHHRTERGGNDWKPLSEGGIYQMVKDTAARTGWERRIYPHLFRHSAISRMAARGMHPALISEVMGVSAAVIAEHYSHPSTTDLYNAAMAALRED